MAKKKTSNANNSNKGTTATVERGTVGPDGVERDENGIPTDTSDLMDESSSPALQLPANGGGLLPSAPVGSQLLTDRARTDHDLASLFDAKHAGGSLPLIKFTREGQAVVALYLAREAPTDQRDFGVIVFDVIDTKRLAATRDPAASILCRAQLTESTAVEDYFAKAKVGQLVRLTFVGTTKTKRGLSDMKLITVEELSLKGAAS